MATSPNFNWPEPDNTDLVKNGALAIRTAVNAIDTSLVDLKGGTTGQVLAKASGTDMDFSWVAQDDSNAIQNAIVDAKGDLIGATAADTPARLAVGTNGQVLTADSTAATGLAWATPSAGSSFAGAYVTNSTNTTVSNNTLTTLAFNQETYDTNAFHDNSTNNSRLTIPSGKAGYYLVTAQGQWDVNATARRELILYKNGSAIGGQEVTASSSAYPSHSFNLPLSLAVGDYLEIKCYQGSGGNLIFYTQQFQVSYLGA
jgi:hypothetical protein